MTKLTRALILSIFFTIGTASAVLAQGAIEGTVTDATSGEPLPGVNVVISELNLGAATDVDGAYVITGVPAGEHTVEARFVGFQPSQEQVTVEDGETSVVDFALRESALELEEIVVTGQGGGVEKRRLSTTVDAITSQDLDRVNAGSLDEMLQNAMPSASVRMSGGMPGTSSIIRSRGITSANTEQTPVIYVDGVRVDNQNSAAALSNFSGGLKSSSIADIPVENIERVEFIKGGAATTLYGSDAANGVIQIFTKKGYESVPQFTFETTQGVNVAKRDYLRRESTGDILYQPRNYQNYVLSGSGGGEDITYSFSAAMSDNPGHRTYEIGSTKYNLRTTVSANLLEGLEYTGSASFVSHDFDRKENANLGGALRRLDEGYWGKHYLLEGDELEAYKDSILERETLYNFTEDVKRFQTSQNLSYNPVEGLETQIVTGVDYRVSSQLEYAWTDWYLALDEVPSGATNEGFMNRFTRRFLSLSLEGNAQYTYDFGDFSTVTTVGGQVFRDEDDQIVAEGDNIADGSLDLDTGATQDGDDFTLTLVNYGAYLAENIGYKNRYFLELGLRGDANTAFGEEVGIQWYPKVGVSYLLSDEAFFSTLIPESVVSSLKLRANYGVAGNFPDAFANESTVIPNPYNAGGDDSGLALQFGRPGDPNLKPEKTYTWEGGTDLTLFSDNVVLEFTYYYAVTRDALFQAPFVPSSGEDDQLRNLGEIENRGFELQTTWSLSPVEDLNLSLTGSLNYNENEVISTGGAPPFQLHGFSVFGSWVREGYPVGYLRGTRVVLDENGEIEELISNANLGNPTPSHYGSLNLSGNYKNWSLFISSDYQWGGEGFFTTERYRLLNDAAEYQATGEDPNWANWADRDWKRHFLEGNLTSSDMGDVLITSSDFWKVRRIQLGYTLPESVVNSIGLLRSAQVRAAVHNPFDYTPPGSAPTDPELHGYGQNSQGKLDVGGFLYGSDPQPRRYQLTLRVGL